MRNLKTFLLLQIVLFVTYSVLGQENSVGWTSLFDGKTLNGWKRATGTAKYAVQDGMIVGTTVLSSPNSFLATEKEYGDFILEAEVKLEDTASNSGIQFRSHFDAAANDGKGKVFGYQFELDPSGRSWTAGIYDEGRRGWLYPLTLNPSAQDGFKLGEFNKVHVECIGNEVKTWINGIPAAFVVDTFGRKGFIALQVHSIGNNANLAGKKIYFKNIRIKTGNISATPFSKGIYVINNISNYLSDYERKDGWKLLFDGVSSKGWVRAYKTSFPDKGWVIKDGILTVLSSEGKESANGGDIVTSQEYTAFDLSFEFKLTPGANSGVKYFVTLTENNQGSAIGLEYQILDDARHPDAKLGRNGNRTLSSLYDLIPAKTLPAFIHKIGEWNTGRIVVDTKNHVEHYLNGIKVLEYERSSPAYRNLVALSKYKIWTNFGEATKGHILLQDHGNEVSFRSIKIKVLK